MWKVVRDSLGRRNRRLRPINRFKTLGWMNSSPPTCAWYMRPWTGSVCLIYASVNWVSVASNNSMSPVWRQYITWISADLLSIGRNLIEIRFKLFYGNAFETFVCEMAAISSGEAELLSSTDDVNHCLAEFRLGNIKLYLQFLSCISTEMVRVLEIFQRGGQGFINPEYSTP